VIYRNRLPLHVEYTIT